MAIKIFGILIALFTITFTILSLQDPYSLNLQAHALNFKNIEAQNLRAYESNTSVVKAYYKTRSWIRYANKDEFYDFINLNLDFNLSAKRLEFFDKDMNKVLFEGNVTYVGLNGVKITSEEVEYQPKDKILYTHTDFKALINGNIINGNILNYDIKNKILNIQGVNACLREK
ncbi:hypothetical protein N4T57_05550 [Campylobacter hepaticus]|uniref:LPS export ABC transporter periplasmic protein LptC n=1 Tax=Campylobacter hepaticus TaxID=1813019 RepID=A0A424Z1B0_9BACT|nr:hypothetical protein [Campylobacter hepaticus]AXP08751.1 hypothetical protein A2J15_003380 [Campylobacter hepaticus]MCZ0772601.1 hypothetical protein [Campylobacter hepaticus]MCZ0774069.1 hypothetical protein [Campylobacter hepaticus]MCZ0775321.1 hypothetical protein [Campylobacter hepaticus]MDX2323033.1 hypothetical protein [Campylobacter hepaticus]